MTEPSDTVQLTADTDERTESQSSVSVERKDSEIEETTLSEQTPDEENKPLVNGDSNLINPNWTPDSLPPTPRTPKRSVALADPSSDWMEHVDPIEELKLKREGSNNKARFCDSSFKVPFYHLSNQFNRYFDMTNLSANQNKQILQLSVL